MVLIDIDQGDTESIGLSCILKDRYLRIQKVVSGLILTKELLRNFLFEIELYLVRQIPENTDRVISGLIMTKVLLRSHKLFKIELYLVRQMPENADRVISELILTKVFLQ